MDCNVDGRRVVSEYWNENVSNWKVANHLESGSESFFKEVERYRFEKLEYLTGAIPFQKLAGQTILDVGCGLGTDTSRFAFHGANITGVDVAPRAIELATKNFSWRGLSGDFVVMDGEELQFDDNTFDFVYCHTVLHFTPRPEKMISEIKRVLKPGGRGIVMTINRKSWLFYMHRFAGVKIDYMDAPYFHTFDLREFEALTDTFEKKIIRMFRFPVRTEVHKGWKAKLYNLAFVDAFNALPKRLTQNAGYHMLAYVDKAA